jgi:hypothetical protein
VKTSEGDVRGVLRHYQVSDKKTHQPFALVVETEDNLILKTISNNEVQTLHTRKIFNKLVEDRNNLPDVSWSTFENSYAPILTSHTDHLKRYLDFSLYNNHQKEPLKGARDLYQLPMTGNPIWAEQQKKGKVRKT